MTCLREVILAYGPTTMNASDFELTKLRLRRENFDTVLERHMIAENRRKGIQCHLLDIYRRQQGVYEQASLPYSKEGREKMLNMIRELFYAETLFDRRFTRENDIREENEVERDNDATASGRLRCFFGCFSRHR